MKARRAIAIAAVWVGTVSAGCTPSRTLGLRRPDATQKEVDAVRARLDAVATPPGPPLLVGRGRGEDQDRLWVAPLDGPNPGRPRWSQETPSADAPLFAGPWVLTREEGRVVGRRVGDGATGFEESAGALSLVGAAGVGDAGVAVLSTGTATTPESRILLLGPRGVRGRVLARQAAGAPAMIGPLALVPWGAQTVSVFASEGEERARIRVPGAYVAAVTAAPGAGSGGVWLGWRALIPLGETGDPPPGAEPPPPTLDLFALAAERLGADPEALGERFPRPTPLPDAYAMPPNRGGFGRRQWLLFDPAGSGPPTLVLVTPRSILGMTPEGAGRWGRVVSEDVVGAHPQPGGGALIALASGVVMALDGDGRLRGRVDLGRGLSAAQMRGVMPLGAAGDGGDGSVDEDDALPDGPVDGAARILAAPRGDRSVAGLAAVVSLCQQPSPEATTVLIDACAGRARDPGERAWACEALARRRSGLDPVLEALRTRVDFLTVGRTPPVGALAGAAATGGRRDALPLLVAWLQDPRTRSQDLARLVGAIGVLGASKASGPLQDFLRRYHADAVDRGVGTALVAAAEALRSIDGALAVPFFSELAEDPFTVPALRAALIEHLADLEALDAQP